MEHKYTHENGMRSPSFYNFTAHLQTITKIFHHYCKKGKFSLNLSSDCALVGIILTDRINIFLQFFSQKVKNHKWLWECSRKVVPWIFYGNSLRSLVWTTWECIRCTKFGIVFKFLCIIFRRWASFARNGLGVVHLLRNVENEFFQTAIFEI